MLRLTVLALVAALRVLAADATPVDRDFARTPSVQLPSDSGKGANPLNPKHVARVIDVSDLHWAAIAGDLAEVRRLLNARESITATETLWGGETVLHWGAYGGNPNVVRALLAAGVPIEAKDDDGETALREALRVNDPGFLALQALLVAGADPEARGRDGSTALHEAVFLSSEHAATAVLLLRMFGADPNAKSGESQSTPLHRAALQPYDRFSGWPLIDKTYDPSGRAADVNARDSAGMTPLHWLASMMSSAEDSRVARWLISNGADVKATDDRGYTAFDWAEGTGADELVDVLRRAMD